MKVAYQLDGSGPYGHAAKRTQFRKRIRSRSGVAVLFLPRSTLAFSSIMSDSWRRSYCSHSNYHRQAILRAHRWSGNGARPEPANRKTPRSG
jgi:hypothetical protein